MSTATATNPSDPIAEVERRIDEIVARGILNEAAAHKKVMKMDANLRHRYVVATNVQHGRMQRAKSYTSTHWR